VTLHRCRPVIDLSMRDLCKRPYPGHPRGCPNYGKRATCPPRAPLLGDAYVLQAPCFLVVNEFDLSAHVRRMRRRHPGWSDRQLRCCLYWQGTARKQLRDKVRRALLEAQRYSIRERGVWSVEYVPEAMGMNVTATCAQIGIDLEWPPERVVRQVAFIGLRRSEA
jgi:predicted metal-binding protein